MSFALRILALSAFCAVFAAGCGGGGVGTVMGGEPISLVALKNAGQASAAAKSGRFEFSLEMSLPEADKPFAFTGEGAFDATSQRTAFTIDMSSFAGLLGGPFSRTAGAGAVPDWNDPKGWKIDAVQDGSVVYVKFPAIADQLPAGTSWVKTNAKQARGGSLEQSRLQQLTGSDPRNTLDFLRAVSGEIETVGADTLHGVSTTHYRATIEPSDYAKLVPADKRDELGSLADQLVARSGIGAMPVDVWVDGSGLVRKLVISFAATQPGTTHVTEASMTFELYDLGEDVEIALPAASEVVDASALHP